MNDDKKSIRPADGPLNEEMKTDNLQDKGGGKAGRSTPSNETEEVLNNEATKEANAQEDLGKI